MAAKPTSLSRSVPTNEVKSSGMLPPAVMKAAPVTSIEMPSCSTRSTRDGTTNSSQTLASAMNM